MEIYCQSLLKIFIFDKHLDTCTEIVYISHPVSKKRPVIREHNFWAMFFIIAFALAFIIGIALLLFTKLSHSYDMPVKFSSRGGLMMYSVENTKELQNQLHLYKLYDAGGESVEPYILKRFPKDFHRYSANTRKKIFIKVMLPIALVAKERFDAEHKMLVEVKNEMKLGRKLNDSEKLFLSEMMKGYKTSDINELVKKADSVPVSLLIAQAAIESGWGKSRFTTDFNNIYGIHRKHRKPGQPIVLSFDNLYNATFAYIMNLNRNMAYKNFRDARYAMKDKKNPYVLADYLSLYSIKRRQYVSMIQRVIMKNKLTQYDNYKINQVIVGAASYAVNQ